MLAECNRLGLVIDGSHASDETIDQILDLSRVERTDHRSYCPYKGEASYFSIPAGGSRSVNAIWTYETPHASAAAIKDYVAFYGDRVDSIAMS